MRRRLLNRRRRLPQLVKVVSMIKATHLCCTSRLLQGCEAPIWTTSRTIGCKKVMQKVKRGFAQGLCQLCCLYLFVGSKHTFDSW